MLRIAHLADLHYCTKHLRWVDRAFDFAIQKAIADCCDVAVIAGDLADAALTTHDPAVSLLLERIKILADHMPVLILQGTYSHDRPGSLDIFRTMGGKHEVFVADEPVQLILKSDLKFEVVDCDAIHMTMKDVLGVFSCLPSLNKADPKIIEAGAPEWVRAKMLEFKPLNDAAESTGLPSILVSHGTVSGAVTESKHALVSPDHEFSVETLFSSGADATMLGHIHKQQGWTNPETGQEIMYAGSITTLVHGVTDPAGFLIWDFQQNENGKVVTEIKRLDAPGRRMIELSYDELPDMEELADVAKTVDGDCYVRLRYFVDQEYAHKVDKPAIKEMFAGAASFKDEGTILIVESVRSKGISHKESIPAKLTCWAETTGDANWVPELIERLHLLQSMDTEKVLATTSERLAKIVEETGSAFPTSNDVEKPEVDSDEGERF